MNETDDPFVVLENKLNENKKERMIDELLGDDIQYKTVLVGKNATHVWIDDSAGKL